MRQRWVLLCYDVLGATGGGGEAVNSSDMAPRAGAAGERHPPAGTVKEAIVLEDARWQRVRAGSCDRFKVKAFDLLSSLHPLFVLWEVAFRK